MGYGYLQDSAGNKSAKRLWGTILLSNALLMGWYGIISGTDVKMMALQFLGSGVALLGASIGERRK